MNNKFYFFGQFLLGLCLCALSFLILFYKESLFYLVFFALGMIVLINTLLELLSLLKNKNLKDRCINLIFQLVFGMILCFYPEFQISVLVIIFALYVLMSAISHFITYLYYRKDKVSGRFSGLLIGIVLLYTGIVYLLAPFIHSKDFIVILSIYLLLLGLKSLLKAFDELLYLTNNDSIKRRLRIALPVFIEAIVPRILLDYINEQVKVDEKTNNISKNISLEIMIHISKEGFGAIGHVDLYYNHQVIAYGAYDESSHKMFGALADGVMFTSDKESYIDFCLKDDPTQWIFVYGISLTKKQEELVKQQIASLNKQTKPWHCAYEVDKDAHDYASRLYKHTQASFYKFVKGRFKHYFVMTTNCVMLADYIVGESGFEIINMNGMITPGSYYSYLEEESKKENSRVIYKEVYRG